ncbi:hypothetical protein WJX73_006271 [Symbiochloris irregularis]|uniref:E3 ubiquitin-protein ligase n=1 Tax=Symbiochloris irregularis TaxID=706552 RepID=A0AAW1NUM0_9CHLO
MSADIAEEAAAVRLRWKTSSASVTSCLEASEALLCKVHQVASINAYLSAISAATRHLGGQCTNLWRTGTVSYRCKTCQKTNASAICPACFKAGGHDKHDYIMYLSPAGGCCDCGDPTAWAVEGCCPQHRPLSSSELLKALPEGDRAVLAGILEGAFARLAQELTNATGGSEAETCAFSIVMWLQMLVAVPPIRRVAADAAMMQPQQQHSRSVSGTATPSSISEAEAPSRTPSPHSMSYRQILSCCLPNGRDANQQANPPRPRHRNSIDVPSALADARANTVPPQLAQQTSGEVVFAMDLDASGPPIATPAQRQPAVPAQGGSTPPASPIQMHRSAYTPPHRRRLSSVPSAAPDMPSLDPTVMNQQGLHPLTGQLSLPVGKQGNSGWDAYLNNRKARRISSTGGRYVKDMPMAGIVRAMVHMPRDLLEEATRLLLALLYEQDFKMAFARALMEVYGTLTLKQGAEGQHMGAMLDQLVVQLFLSEELTGELVQEDGLLECFLNAFNSLLSTAARDDASRNSGRRPSAVPCKPVSMSHPLIHDRMYFRILADTHLVVSHLVAVEHLFANRVGMQHLLSAPPRAILSPRRSLEETTCFEDLVLPALERLHGMLSYTRKHGEHIEYENDDWMLAMYLELETIAQLVNPILSRLTPRQPDADLTMSLEARLQALVKAIQATGRRVLGLPVPFPFRRTETMYATMWEELHSDSRGDSRLATSPHLPLHHLLATLTSILLCYQEDPRILQLPVERAIAAVLRDGGPQHSPQEDRWMPKWRTMAQASVRVLAWVAQVENGMWALNGRTVERVAYFYRCPSWACTALDLDIFLLQLWAATTAQAQPFGFILDLLLPFGATPLLWAACRRTPSGGFAFQHAAAALFDRLHSQPEQKHEPGKLMEFMRTGQLPGDGDLEQEIEEKRLACIVHGLRWLLTVLRYSPALDKASRLKRDVVHALAVTDAGHADLQRSVASELQGYDCPLDEALDEVAEHVSPDAHTKGRYRLKSEAWADWDPHHPHYTRKDRDQALHNARKAKWRPESQMHALGRPLPRTLRSLLRLLDNPLLLSVAWCLLRYATLHPGGASDDLATTAASLLSMAMDRAWAPVTPVQRSPLREELARSLTQLMRGGEKFRPGALKLLQDVADSESTGWEAKACTSHLVARASELLEKIPVPLESPSSRPLSRQSSAASSVHESDLPSPATPSAVSQQQADEQAKQEAFEARKARMKARQAAAMAKIKAKQAAFDSQANTASDPTSPVGDQENAGAFSLVAHAHMCSIPSKALARSDPASAASSCASLEGCTWPHINPHPCRSVARSPALSMADGCAGVHVTACGHIMHTACHAQYMAAQQDKERSQVMFTGVGIISPQMGEFLCLEDQRSQAVHPAVQDCIQETARQETAQLQVARELGVMGGLIGRMQAAATLDPAPTNAALDAGAVVAQGAEEVEALEGEGQAEGWTILQGPPAPPTRAETNAAAATAAAAQDGPVDMDSLRALEQSLATLQDLTDANPDALIFPHNNPPWAQQGEAAAEEVEPGHGTPALWHPDATTGQQIAVVRGQAAHIRMVAARLRGGQADVQDNGQTPEDAMTQEEVAESVEELLAATSALETSVWRMTQGFSSGAVLHADSASPAQAAAAASVAAVAHSRAAARQPQAARLWALIAHGAVHWEVIHRGRQSLDPAAAEASSAPDAGQWPLHTPFSDALGMRHANVSQHNGAPSASVTEQMHAERRATAAQASSSGGGSSSMASNTRRPLNPWSWASLVADPFALTLQLWALGLTATRGAYASPVDTLQAIIPLIYTMAVAQACEALARWRVRQPDAGRAVHGTQRTPTPAPGPLQLAFVPHEYQDLYLDLVSERCGRCGQVPKDPALCLGCGQVLCCHETQCSTPNLGGPCFCHALTCGAGTGVYLLIKGTQVLVLRRGRSTLLAPFYLDVHGEEDPYLRRGRALRLF